MEKIKPNKSQMTSILALIIIVGGYAVERMVSILFAPDKTAGLIMAMVYTVLVAVVYLLISKAEDVTAGLLAALVGYKMMPPTLSVLDKTTIDGSMLYFVVRKAAVIIFVILALKLYEKQPRPRAIKPLAILGIMVLVPFFAEIGNRFGAYFMIKTGSMLYAYFTDYICYSLATVFVVFFAYKSSAESMRFTAVFEYVALGINILRRLLVIIMLATKGEHISKNYFVWLVVYLVLIGMVAFAQSKKQKEIKA